MPTKKKIAKLVQSPKNQAIVVTLAEDEIGILSGVMGGCCSIIVLWDYDEGAKVYKEVRGHHAGGGPGNLDWDSLLANVPSGAGTKIVMSCAPNNYNRGESSYITQVKDALSELGFQAKGKFLDYTNVYVTRDGKAKNVDNYDFEDEKKFKIRNKNKRAIQ